MQIDLLPFNIELLLLNSNSVRTLRPVTVLDIFEGSSKNFHPAGLFSTEIFGLVGEQTRSTTFAYIDLKVPVIHPALYKALDDMKSLYGDIMSGKVYATWDNATGNFEKSTPSEGQTGYSFFMEHFKDMEYADNPSVRTQHNIALLKKYRDRSTFDKLLVIPAGLRDFEFDENGKPGMSIVNDYYRRILGYANFFHNYHTQSEANAINTTHYNLQIAVNTVYLYFKSLLEGKKKFILGRLATRKTFNSTRNVISSLINDTDRVDDPKLVSYNQTAIGLYQAAKILLPITIHRLKQGIISKAFPGPNAPAQLVNKQTLSVESVEVHSNYYDDWLSNEGLERMITRFGEEDIRHLPIEIGGYWLGLVYADDRYFKVIQSQSEVPKNFEGNVTPMTLFELLYFALYEVAHTYPTFITRYPITAYGSIYPSYIYLKTTTRTTIKTELDDQWQPTHRIAYEYPLFQEPSYNAMSPHSSHLSRLGADFDGDTCSAQAVYTDEAREEVQKLLNSKRYYIASSGKMAFSARTDIIDYVLASMTGD